MDDFYCGTTFIGECPDCGSAVRSLQHDGRCPRCADPLRQPDAHAIRRAQAKGFEATARLLRSLGGPFAVEAEWHEEQARRRRS